ncbi:unnamed protein product [Haemonchus placei]|uniref:Transposase n=1 Tax=Haemonchus placei TaxID=6290 RepID=A0A0N4X0A2_HAEPC|nr:unnamed protein product [Haemonchus placei]
MASTYQKSGPRLQAGQTLKNKKKKNDVVERVFTLCQQIPLMVWKIPNCPKLHRQY